MLSYHSLFVRDSQVHEMFDCKTDARAFAIIDSMKIHRIPRILLLVGRLFAMRANKRPTKEEKYHAAVRPEPVEGQAKAAFAYALSIRDVLSCRHDTAYRSLDAAPK